MLIRVVMLIVVGFAGIGEHGVVEAETTGQEEGAPYHPCRSSAASQEPMLQGVQIETADIGAHERFLSDVMGANEVLRIDHPQVDHLRGYCYRGVLVIVRQDLRTPRPTGWIQVNFTVSDVGAVQREVEEAVARLAGSTSSGEDAGKTVRVRLKADVPRTNCRAVRLEVGGPEGFMIGFDQFKEGTCKPRGQESMAPPPTAAEHSRPHHEGR